MFDWAKLQNPIYSHPGWSVKDACWGWHGDWLYLFFSAFFVSRGQERSHVVSVKTQDLLTFSDPLFIWDGAAEGWSGLCSPNLSLVEKTHVLTFNSWGEEHPNGQTNQLFYATSTDLESWTSPQPLAKNLTQGQRAIDAALTKTDDKLYLVWKEQQTPQLAVAHQLDGPWNRLGTPSGGWFENAQLLQINGHWHLLMTGPDHAPYLMQMTGNGEQDQDWLTWAPPRRLEIPEESFNTDEPANAAFLADWRLLDGYFYLLYAGRTEGKTHAGRGNNKLGVARSKNLQSWHVPR